MKRIIIIAAAVLAGSAASAQERPVIPTKGSEDTKGIMSKAYWDIWNDGEQARIDKDIEAYRKADATFHTGDVKRGSSVKVRQVKSDFIFGASAFNWDQLGNHESNVKYKNLFGSLFNRATVPFYWQAFEPEYGRKRYDVAEDDTEQWWSTVKNPEDQRFWRRPATNQIVDWCIQKGIEAHGHPLVWGSRSNQHPAWLKKEGIPAAQQAALDSLETVRISGKKTRKPTAKGFGKMPQSEVYKLVPDYIKNFREKNDAHIEELMTYYKGKIGSWDIVNESSTDFGRGNEQTLYPLIKSSYGLMPADYTFHFFKTAEKFASKDLLMNINDYNVTDRYPSQIAHLLSRGTRIDVIGSQMHLFQPKQCLDIAAGKSPSPAKKRVDPETVRSFFDKVGAFGIPTCISEVTISSPGSDEKGEMIQAIITRNLYRIWFSQKSMMGITWWNVVDGCGLKGEPTVSGLFHRDMTPKTAFYALDNLINHEWKTNLELKPDGNGDIRFRGFKGTYEVSWTDKKGVKHTETITVR